MAEFEDSNDKLFAANTDLFDAEIDNDSEVNNDGEENDLEVENSEVPEKTYRKSDEENPFRDSESSEEESIEKIKQKAKRIREPSKRKMKTKLHIQDLHRESQRLVRESNVKLPYHQPKIKDIRQFLKKPPMISDINYIPSGTESETKDEDVTYDPKSCPSNDLAPAEDVLKSEKVEVEQNSREDKTVAKPKLTELSDLFFLDDNEARKPPGLNLLMERFFKHNKGKLKQTEKVIEEKKPDVIELADELEKTSEGITGIVKNEKKRPVFQSGAGNLHSLKEQLHVNMRQKRAEVRKIHESTRKLDEEEVSEEEEELDDDEDSDFEMDEWNMEDERAQVERELESEDKGKDEMDDLQSVEDFCGIADSETKSKVTMKSPSRALLYSDEQTIDLFPSDNSNQATNHTLDENASDCETVASEESIKLRLDSFDNTQDGFHDSSLTHAFTKSKIHEHGSNSSSLPCAQPQKTRIVSKSLNSSDSSDALTAFSRIQKLLGVDCSSDNRYKEPRPISELSLPVENSQDLKEEEDEDVDRRFSRGLNTSKDFNFSLDEDTQFTQFVDTQGYLLSASKKRKENKENSNNMSELLGLCSGTFSSDKTTSETEKNMSEILGLCSGEFSTAENKKSATESQDNMNELLGLCSGTFESKKTSEGENMDELGACGGQKTSKTRNMSKSLGLSQSKCEDSTSERQNMKELLGLCSGKFDEKKSDVNISDIFGPKSNFSQLQSDSGVGKDEEAMSELLSLCSGRFSSADSAKNSKSEGNIFSKQDQSKPNSRKQNLTSMFDKIGDEDDVDDVATFCSGEFSSTQKYDEESRAGKDADENSDEEVFSDDERQLDSDNEKEEDTDDPEEAEIRKSKKYGIAYGKKMHSIFNKENFVEDEAELSGSDASSDEEEGSEDDEIEEDSEIEDLPSDDELQRQVNKVHLKSVIDEDKRELRELKERYLEDGDLYSEGGRRARNFRWHGLDDSQNDMFENKVLWGDDEIVDNELLSAPELERRKMKHEKEQFLQDQLSRDGDLRTTNVDENSQNILDIINDRSSAAADDDKNTVAVKTTAPKLVRQDSTSKTFSQDCQKRGSFLSRNKDQMSRISSVTMTKKTPNSTRGFVFHSISPSSKTKNTTTKKLQRSVPLSEPPNPKKLRLDKTISNIARGSLFAAMPV